jgi:hypothetical protein
VEEADGAVLLSISHRSGKHTALKRKGKKAKQKNK